MTLTDAPSSVPVLPAIDISDDALAAVRDTLAETAQEYDRSGEYPVKGIQAVHDAGLLRLGIGARYGGQELSSVDSVRVFEALGQGDPAVALIASMTVFQHVLQAANPWWPEDVYRALVADSLQAPQVLNAVRAEPEWGAPARGGLPATTVRKVEGGWLLNGRKGFATGSEGLRYHLVWAVTADEEWAEDPLLAHAVVPGDAPGLEIVKTWDHLGQRASSTHDVIYTDVLIPDDHFRGTPNSQLALGTGGQGGGGALAIGLGVAGLYVGVARAAQAWYHRFAHERVPTSLGRPIATTERIQSVAGEIEAQLVLAEELLLGLAARFDAGEPVAPQRVALGKLLSTRAAITAVQTAVAALGNPALSRHHPLERHLRDVLASRVHPPQEDAALLFAGRAALAAAAPVNP